jgi:hypothetical protein
MFVVPPLYTSTVTVEGGGMELALAGFFLAAGPFAWPADG